MWCCIVSVVVLKSSGVATLAFILSGGCGGIYDGGGGGLRGWVWS